MTTNKFTTNNDPTLVAVNSSDGETPVYLYADPITHGLVVSGTVSIINSELADTTGTFTNATQSTAIATTGSLDGYEAITISINGTYATATGVFEGSDDGGTTWYTLQGARTDSAIIEVGYTGVSNVTRIWTVQITGLDMFRVRSTAVASGTVNVRISVSDAPTADASVVSVGQTPPDNVTTGTIVANGGTVTTTVTPGMAGWTMGYYGTYSTGASLTMEVSFDGGATYSACRMLAGATSTLGYVVTIAVGSNVTAYFTADIPAGATHLRARCSAWAAPTGTINIVLGQSMERFASPAIGGQNVVAGGAKTSNAAIPAATNIGVLPSIANAAKPTFVETFQTALSTDLSGNTRTRINDAAGNDRGANVNANNELLIIDQGLRPAATALNTYATRITTNATTTPTASTAYISSIVITTEIGGTTSTVTIRDKQGTPQVLVNGLTTTAASLSPTVINFQTPVKMTSGIDVITAGAVAGTVDIWVNYYQ